MSSWPAARVAWTAGSWIQAHYSRRWPPDRFVRAGIVVVIAGLATFMLILSPAVPVWFSVPTFALAGLGMGLAYAPLTLIVLPVVWVAITLFGFSAMYWALGVHPVRQAFVESAADVWLDRIVPLKGADLDPDIEHTLHSYVA